MILYADGCWSRLNSLSKAVADIPISANAVQAASNVFLASAPEPQANCGSHGITGESLQFDTKPKISGAGLEPNSFQQCIAT